MNLRFILRIIFLIAVLHSGFSSPSYASSCAVFSSEPTPWQGQLSGSKGTVKRLIDPIRNYLTNLRLRFSKAWRDAKDEFRSIDVVADFRLKDLERAEQNLAELISIADSAVRSRRLGKISEELSRKAEELSLPVEGRSLDELFQTVAEKFARSIHNEQTDERHIEKLYDLRQRAFESQNTMLLHEVDLRLDREGERNQRLEEIHQKQTELILKILPLESEIANLLERVRFGDRNALMELAQRVPDQDTHFPPTRSILTLGETRLLSNHYSEAERSHDYSRFRASAFKTLNQLHPLLGILAREAALEGANGRFQRAWANHKMYEVESAHSRRPLSELDGYLDFRAEFIQAARIYLGELEIAYGEVESGPAGLEIATFASHPLGKEAQSFQNPFLRANGQIPREYPNGVRIIYSPEMTSLNIGARSDLVNGIIYLSHEVMLRLRDRTLHRQYRHEKDHQLILSRKLWFAAATVGDRKSTLLGEHSETTIGGEGFQTHVSEFVTYYKQVRRGLEAMQMQLLHRRDSKFRETAEELRREIEVAVNITHFIESSLIAINANDRPLEISSKNDDWVVVHLDNKRYRFEGLIPTEAIPLSGFEDAFSDAISHTLQTIRQRYAHYDQAITLLDRKAGTAEEKMELYKDLEGLINKFEEYELDIGDITP